MVLHEFSSILIGQIGKNDAYKKQITGDEIMSYCMSHILDGQSFLSGRIVILECRNVEYLKNFYMGYGFCMLEEEYGKDDLLQFYRILEESEIIVKSPS